MSRWVRLLDFVLLVAAALAFTAANGGERVHVELGVITLQRVSLPVVVFASVLLGMVICIVAGLRTDLRNRRRMHRWEEFRDRDG